MRFKKWCKMLWLALRLWNEKGRYDVLSARLRRHQEKASDAKNLAWCIYHENRAKETEELDASIRKIARLTRQIECL